MSQRCHMPWHAMGLLVVSFGWWRLTVQEQSGFSSLVTNCRSLSSNSSSRTARLQHDTHTMCCWMFCFLVNCCLRACRSKAPAAGKSKTHTQQQPLPLWLSKGLISDHYTSSETRLVIPESLQQEGCCSDRNSHLNISQKLTEQRS
jgi:hypothetical protein